MNKRNPAITQDWEDQRTEIAEILPVVETGSRSLVPARETGPLASGSQFHNVSQGKPIHGLISSSTAPQHMQINAITHTGTIESEGTLITIDEEFLLKLSPQTFKVLIMYLTKAADQLPHGDKVTADAIQRNRKISLYLEEYMSACDLRDKKTAREQLNAAVLGLYGISLEWDEKEYVKPEGRSRKVNKTVHHRMRIIEQTATNEKGKPISGGKAEIWLTPSMAEYLARAYIMPISSALLRINTHNNPYSIPFGWKLCSLDNVNITNNNPERVGRTTVQTLLNAAKGIPRYETIAKRGNIYDLLIKPFDRDMRALVEAGVLSSYSYYDEAGNQIDSVAALNYSTFSSLNIRYEIKNYPDQTMRIEAKQKRISNAIARNKKKKDSQDQQNTTQE